MGITCAKHLTHPLMWVCETCHLDLDADNSALRARLEEVERSNQALAAALDLYKEYVAFFDKANDVPITLAFVHGWRCPDEDVRRGKEYREQIDAALAAARREGA